MVGMHACWYALHRQNCTRQRIQNTKLDFDTLIGTFKELFQLRNWERNKVNLFHCEAYGGCTGSSVPRA